MSFYTALTGLNGSQADISATSNNIANVGTTGFKRSRAEFGDIFATSPLQNSSSSIGSGAILKGVKQQFTQGNIASSLNALDLAISGQGFFALKPSLTSTQLVYTRNGSFNVDNNRNVVDSSGQFLLTYPVNDDGSVTAKDLDSAVPLRLPVTSGDPQATSMIDLAVNLPADAEVVTEKDKFAAGYTFDPNDPESYTNSTSLTIFDDLGNPTIATVYFIKTQRATAEDPTNKFDTRLVINDVVINPDLVPAVDSSNNQIFIDKFGNQTTEVPDPSYFNTGRSSPLYKLDDIQERVPSTPATLTGAAIDISVFGPEGTNEIEIVTDPMLYGATSEAQGTDTGVYWGKNFLVANVDDGTRPVNVDIRPGFYNAEELAREVERAINAAYDDEKTITIRAGVDNQLSLQFYTQNNAGSETATGSAITIDLLGQSTPLSVVDPEANAALQQNTTVASFELDTFVAHAQDRINQALNAALGEANSPIPGIDDNQFVKVTGLQSIDPNNVSNPQSVVVDYTTRNLGISNVSVDGDYWTLTYVDGVFSLEEAATGTLPDPIEYSFDVNGTTISGSNSGSVASTGTSAGDKTAILGDIMAQIQANASTFAGSPAAGDFTFSPAAADGTPMTVALTMPRYVTYSNYQNRPSIDVYETTSTLATGAEIDYNVSTETLTINVAADLTSALGNGDEFQLIGLQDSATTADLPSFLNGRKLTVQNVTWDSANSVGTITVAAADLNLSASNFPFTVAAAAPVHLVGGRASDVEAYFEGADTTVEMSAKTFNTRKIVFRETDAYRQANGEVAITVGATDTPVFALNATSTVITTAGGATETTPAIEDLGLNTLNTTEEWVDDRDPPIKVRYDASTQSLAFDIDQNAIGPGGQIADVSALELSAEDIITGTNSFGVPASAGASRVAITSNTSVEGEPFVLGGAEAGGTTNRYGVEVNFNRDNQSFEFASGTTGEAIAANKALGVTSDQRASNIQIGRHMLDSSGNISADSRFDLGTNYLANGDNGLLGVGANANFEKVEGRGLRSEPARAVGSRANDPLDDEPIFLNPANLETTFNVSVDGINAVIDIPGGFYLGTTLAEVLEQRINQMRDPETGQTIGGVTVRYQPVENNFVFTTGTTGDTSTIRVRGPAKLGLDDVPLGVGSIPTIANLVQATNENGIPLYVNAAGEVVDSEPANLVTDYYPLYLDEGELTFDKTGRLLSPQGLTRYEAQDESFSISLDIDYSASTQLATPFAVNNLEQNGFTSGRLDGLDIDATGLLRANYTNGQNKPLGKIVLANFNNQNGLKQVGNATYVETATSGSPIVGEAGSEGFGSIQSGSLERSNVDITEELVNLITAQRNFQASSKAIETSVQLTQTIINIRA